MSILCNIVFMVVFISDKISFGGNEANDNQPIQLDPMADPVQRKALAEKAVKKLVCDNLYYNNSELTGGHYVILIGLEHDMATIVDSNSENGIVNIPALQLYSSAVADHSKTCIWDTDPIFHYHK